MAPGTPGHQPDEQALARAVADLLRAVGARGREVEGTPQRVARTWTREFLDGYAADPAAILADWTPGMGDLVFVRDIDVWGLCPHHLLPFQGRAHIAYLGSRVVGFSRLGALVDAYAHRLDLQERVARNVAEGLVNYLQVPGAACMLDVEQLCLSLREPRRPRARTVAVAFAGAFEERDDLKARFFSLLSSTREAR